MLLKDKLTLDLNLAVKSGNAAKKTALRDIISKMQTVRSSEGREDRGDLTDVEMLNCISKVDNEYRQSIEAFEKVANSEKVEQLKFEQSFIQAYLPRKFNHDETVIAVSDHLINKIQYTKKQMGIVIKDLNVKFPNQLDGKLLAAIVSKILTN